MHMLFKMFFKCVDIRVNNVRLDLMMSPKG